MTVFVIRTDLAELDKIVMVGNNFCYTVTVVAVFFCSKTNPTTITRIRKNKVSCTIA